MRLVALALVVVLSSSVVNAAVNCTLCQDGSVPADLDTPVFVNEGENVTCGQLLEAATLRENVDECEIIQAEGVSLCGCPLPEGGGNVNCTLCQDGSSVPDPDLVFVPGFPCASLEEFVKSDERDGACEAYQVTAGVYCDCPLESSTPNICRLCGGSTELPDPGLLVPISDEDLDTAHNSGTVRPCSAVEFDATFFYDECSRYQQDYGAACCGEPSTTTSAGNVQATIFALIFAATATVAFGPFL